MALLAILSGGPAVISMNRGNVGVLTGVVAQRQNALSLPSLGAVCDYPVVGDVRFGVVYGGGTGNVVLPATTDVLIGVGYGALGTEYTGNATAGGGETSHVF